MEGAEGLTEMIRKIYPVSCAILLLLPGCDPEAPRVINPGEHSCDHCRMRIVDARFAAQAISATGKAFRFDSIECLEAWVALQGKTTPIRVAYVTDFGAPGTWIRREKAKYLLSERLPSPMGAFLSAHDEKNWEQVLAQYGGHELKLAAIGSVLQELKKRKEMRK